ncbi:hypothetical protein MYCTH_2306980 [Thermothelomyces thermophilus ATCC 42464]|uniref:Rad4-domain-containing protein n=1 Tax=Thermothelomyces thermophilus (strain ATCC 42464 / BCRC 31852 / DSM 1799) TaxID=573729 RepID=G2QF26_THET4|nr:uncharacterized protein MYCTH_2306980 [Thermothelomyces thermophilus ATCC 42464]AEO59055.1 hypothetical protein MYCTH_2306980 [Thermothelomyces thermophilus ATCC 42464]
MLPTPTVQTITRSDDEDEDDDIDFEDVVIEPAASSAATPERKSQELSLDLSAHMAAAGPPRPDRRKAISREEKARRLEIHKVHLVCLLAHVELRNRWCNDCQVQDALRPLLPQKTVAALLPRASLNQFGRSESLRRGLQEAKDLFRLKFTITERGLWRALWAEDEEQLKNYQLPDDIDTVLEKSDFIEAARTLQGSRDVGAQLFCALLRSVGVEARLVCSLQPLSFVSGAPTMPRQRQAQTPQKQPSKAELYAAAVAKHETKFPEFHAGATTPSARRRLGHPHATGYRVPSVTAPSHSPSSSGAQGPRTIRGESPFPVYWVEVLDAAHQSWHPVDPLVTGTQWKPHALEPPASDALNSLAYAIAFEADGSARDVTRRYAKAYTSKTRKHRIDNPTLTTAPSNYHPSDPTRDPAPGPRWYRRLLRRYNRPVPTDLDQIELTELAAAEAREPMPRNVADLKDHPVYALERHLRRHEALAPGAEPSGTIRVSAGGGGKAATVERIYRRRDVRVVRSRERWYRMGRVVRDGEEPVKSLPRRKRKREGRRGGPHRDGDDFFFDDDDDDEDDDDPDRVGLFGDAASGFTPLYMLEQTDEYVAPPVVGGRVPKNKFGNLDLYVPSMLPRGGAHVRHPRAAQAAFILGVDYAPALTGFEFRGRHGTAVLDGVVVPEEAADAVWAVIQGLSDMEAEEEQERRSRRALRMWSTFLKGLRIRERIWAGVDAEAEAEAEAETGGGKTEGKGKGKEVVNEKEEGDHVGIQDESEDDIGGGGFFVPDEDDDGGGGGFIVE